MRRIVILLAVLMVWALPARAATSTITGVLTNVDSTTCNYCTITFNSLVQQTISGTTYPPQLVSTKTDGSGNISSITLPQGLAVQISIFENGTSFPAYTAIVPFLSTVTFNTLNQGVLLQPLNILASLYPPTGPLSMNSQKITNLACPTTTDDALAFGCNATVNNLTVTGGFTQNSSGAAFFGLLTDTQISNPTITSATAIGTTGATQYYYFLVCHDGNTGTTLASAGVSVANANATLSGTNYVQIAWTFPTHALNCDILRNTTNTTTGAQSITGGLAVTASPVNDTSNSTSAYTIPTRNTTGDGQFAGALSAGTPTTGIQTGDLSASRAAGTGLLWLGSNGSQSLDFGITNASEFTLTGGGLVLPSTLTVTGAVTLTGGLNTPLAIAQGGNGTASPGLTAGTGISIGSTWPTQSVTVTAAAGSLIPHGQQLFTSNGTFTVPANVYSFVVECWGGGGGGGGFGSTATNGTSGGATTVVGVCSANGGVLSAGNTSGAGVAGGGGGGVTGTFQVNGSPGTAGGYVNGVGGSSPRGAFGGVASSVPGGGGNGGGNGGGSVGSGGAGGGGYAEAEVTTTPASTFGVTIGSGGNAGTGGTASGFAGGGGAALFTW